MNVVMRSICDWSPWSTYGYDQIHLWIFCWWAIQLLEVHLDMKFIAWSMWSKNTMNSSKQFDICNEDSSCWDLLSLNLKSIWHFLSQLGDITILMQFSVSWSCFFSFLWVFSLLFFFMLVSLLLLLEEPVVVEYVSGPDRQSLAFCLLLWSACVICEGKKWERENPCQSCYELGFCYSWVWQRQRRVLEPNPQCVVILQEYAMLHHTCMHKVGNVTQLL